MALNELTSPCSTISAKPKSTTSPASVLLRKISDPALPCVRFVGACVFSRAPERNTRLHEFLSHDALAALTLLTLLPN
jgi:hypothetical protein